MKYVAFMSTNTSGKRGKRGMRYSRVVVRLVELFSRIRGQCPSALSETDTFGSVFASVTNLAEEVFLSFTAVRGIQHLLAHICDMIKTQNRF